MNTTKREALQSPSQDKVIKISALDGDDSFSELSKSQYSMKDVIDLAEFKSLSKQMQLQEDQQNRLVHSYYHLQWNQNSYKFERNAEPPSIYSQEYSKWKGEEPKEDAFKSTYASTLALVNKQQQRQEVDRLLKQYSIDQAIFSYSTQSPLTQINKQYSQSLANVTAKPFQPPSKLQDQSSSISNHSFKPDPVKTWQQKQVKDKRDQKQAVIELEVQQQLLQRLKQINQEEKKLQEKARKDKQLKRTCFKELIERPPISYKKQQKVFIPQADLQQTKRTKYNEIETVDFPKQDDEKLKKQVRYRLNVDEILKIPYRLFLIFYSDNYHQIVRLSSPSDLKRINDYRNDALQRQKAVQKLQRKVAEEGIQIVSQLPSQLKEKLFKVLYEQDLEEQRYAQQQESK